MRSSEALTPQGTLPPDSSAEHSKLVSWTRLTFSVIWILVVLGATAAAWFFLVFTTIGTSIGNNDGANRFPQLLLNLLPFASAILLASGLWLIQWLCKRK